MAVTAVIFDLDGTLADTLDDIADAMNVALGGLGFPGRAAAEYRAFIGDGVASLARRVLPPGRGELADTLVAGFRARYRDHLVDRTRPFDGVAALLDELAARRAPMAVLSNKPDDATRAVVAALFGRWPIGAVAGQRSGVPVKPDPTGALELAAALGVPPVECALVGDGEADMQAARAAGMLAVGALWGFRDRETLVGAGAAHLIERPGELLALLG